MRMRQKNGFTLLEVLVAVGLLAVVSTLMVMAMGMTFKAREEIERIEELNHSATVALRRICLDLSMAYLSNHVNKDEPVGITLFVGKSDSILTTYLGHERRQRSARESDQGVVEYRLEHDPKGQGKVLVRREKSIIDMDPDKGGVKEVLVHNVKEFTLKYWDEKEEDWKDEWRAEMEDALKSGKGGSMPSAIAPPGAKLMKHAQDKMLEEFKLPSRVYIRLVLLDALGREYPFETQTRIHLQYPLNF